MAGILVTGGNGFIGSHLIDKLAGEDHKVVNFDCGGVRYAPSGVSYVDGSILGSDSLDGLAGAADGIVHLAAVSRVADANADPMNCVNVNVMGTLRVLEAARKSQNKPWVIFGSTADALGMEKGKPPSSIYAASKYACELFVGQYARDHDMRTMILRFGFVYGSKRDRPEKVVPKLVGQALRNETLTVVEGVNFGFINYADVVDGIALGTEHLMSRDPGEGYLPDFNLLPDKETSLEELARTIVSVTSSESEVVVNPGIKKGVSLSLPPSMSHPSERARLHLRFNAKVDLEEGIRRLVAEMRS